MEKYPQQLQIISLDIIKCSHLKCCLNFPHVALRDLIPAQPFAVSASQNVNKSVTINWNQKTPLGICPAKHVVKILFRLPFVAIFRWQTIWQYLLFDASNLVCNYQ